MKQEDEKKDPKKENSAAEVPLAEETVSFSKAECEALLARVKELEGMKDNMLRTAADFENAKKRLARDREEFMKFGQERLLRELLPVLDNFERALEHAPAEAEADAAETRQFQPVMAGIRLVYKQLTDILKNQGLVRLETLGKTFDPHLHEAIGFVQEAGDEDVILEEIQPGYKLHERLIRAAKVRVRIAPQGGGDGQAGPEKFSAEDKREEIT